MNKRKRDTNYQSYKPGGQGFGSGYTKNQAIAVIAKIKRKKSYKAKEKLFLTETKTLDINSMVTGGTPLTFNATAQFTLLNPIQNGTAFYQREGIKCVVKSIQINGGFNFLRSQAYPDTGRMLVVHDKNSNGAVPNFSDIIRSLDQTGTVPTSTVDDHKNMVNSERFKIIMDSKHYLPPNAQGVGGIAPNLAIVAETDLQNEHYIRGMWPVQFTSTNSNPITIANISSGALWLITLSGSGSGTEGYNWSGSIRIRYDDH